MDGVVILADGRLAKFTFYRYEEVDCANGMNGKIEYFPKEQLPEIVEMLEKMRQ